MTETVTEPIEGTDDDVATDPATPDEPDTSEQGDHDDAPPPEPETAAMSETDIEAAIDKLTRERDRHVKRIGEIMGDDATALLPCELCEPTIQGFRWPFVADDDPRAAILALLGGDDAAPMLQDPDAQVCDVCNGHGATLTGSRVQATATKPCAKCGAKGWTTEQERTSYEATVGARKVADELAQHALAVPAPSPTTPSVDPWGRPAGAPFFGTNPDYMTAEQKAQDYTRVQV